MMHPILQQFLVATLLVLTLCGIVYHFASLVAARRLLASPPPPTHKLPPVSVLKPVRGVDPEAYANYASFCRQNYPEFEVLFGVQDPTDPAIDLIRQLQADFPQIRIKLVISSEEIGANRKVCNLHNLLLEASYELLVISDSDMRVRPEYLREIAGYFADPRVGLVTSPYCGTGAVSFTAAVEALGIATDFFPGVAVASQFSHPTFGLGSTLALKRHTLAEIGGFEGIADYLADDFQLGNRVARFSHRVLLSRYIVETVLPNPSFQSMYARRLRWMRTVRACQPAGFAGCVITHSTIWAAMFAGLAGFHGWPLGVLLAQQAIRWGTSAYITWFVLPQNSARRWFWLLPISDLINFSLWVESWFGSTVVWRGNRYRLTKGGRMYRIDTEAGRPSPRVGSSHPVGTRRHSRGGNIKF